MEENSELVKEKINAQMEDVLNDEELTIAVDVSDNDIEIEELLGLLENDD